MNFRKHSYGVFKQTEGQTWVIRERTTIDDTEYYRAEMLCNGVSYFIRVKDYESGIYTSRIPAYIIEEELYSERKCKLKKPEKKILKFLEENKGTWYTASEIGQIIGIGTRPASSYLAFLEGVESNHAHKNVKYRIAE